MSSSTEHLPAGAALQPAATDSVGPGGEKPAPRVSVIIPHLNTPEYLVRCLSLLLNQRIDQGTFEVIVVDNGSRLTLEPVQRAFREVRFLSEPTPGPGPARNMGAHHARGEILAFIDADVEVLPGWLQAGLVAIGDDPDGYVGGDIRTAIRDMARLSGLEGFESVFAHRQAKYIKKQHYSATGNVIMTRTVFNRAGPFGGIDMPEDKQFGERAWASGIVARYAPHMIVLHPSRPDFAATRKAWGRLIAQSYAAQQQKSFPALRWHLRALMVALSSFAHMPLVLTSPRIHGIGNRLRTIAFLARIRWARGLDMLKAAHQTSVKSDSLASWNR